MPTPEQLWYTAAILGYAAVGCWFIVWLGPTPRNTPRFDVIFGNVLSLLLWPLLWPMTLIELCCDDPDEEDV